MFELLAYFDGLGKWRQQDRAKCVFRVSRVDKGGNKAKPLFDFECPCIDCHELCVASRGPNEKYRSTAMPGYEWRQVLRHDGSHLHGGKEPMWAQEPCRYCKSAFSSHAACTIPAQSATAAFLEMRLVAAGNFFQSLQWARKSNSHALSGCTLQDPDGGKSQSAAWRDS